MNWDGTWNPEAAVAATGVALTAATAALTLWLLWRQIATTQALVLLENARRLDEQRRAWLEREPVLLIDMPMSSLNESRDGYLWHVRVRNIGGDSVDVKVNLGVYPPHAGGYGISGGEPVTIPRGGQHAFEITEFMLSGEVEAKRIMDQLAEKDRIEWTAWCRITANATTGLISATVAGDAKAGGWLTSDWELFEIPEGRRGARSMEHRSWQPPPSPAEPEPPSWRERLADFIYPARKSADAGE